MERKYSRPSPVSFRNIFLILVISFILIPSFAKAPSNESSNSTTGIKKRTLSVWSEFKDDVLGIDPPRPPPPPPPPQQTLQQVNVYSDVGVNVKISASSMIAPCLFVIILSLIFESVFNIA